MNISYKWGKCYYSTGVSIISIQQKTIQFLILEKKLYISYLKIYIIN